MMMYYLRKRTCGTILIRISPLNITEEAERWTQISQGAHGKTATLLLNFVLIVSLPAYIRSQK